jgi:hypothetical protein
MKYMSPLFYRLLDDEDNEVLGSLLDNIDVCVKQLINCDPKVIDHQSNNFFFIETVKFLIC